MAGPEVLGGPSLAVEMGKQMEGLAWIVKRGRQVPGEMLQKV